MLYYLFVKTIELTYGISLSLVLTCLFLCLISFLIHYLLVNKYFSKVKNSNSWWFFIKRYFFLICGFMFLLGFLGSLISFVKVFV